mmetsp:Transcript_17464/g.19632  ORF Transcript_17464/g.19632 Transcript_17464/m.19632 type:complete len:316 (+) Transcript_17464:23-970(+)
MAAGNPNDENNWVYGIFAQEAAHITIFPNNPAGFALFTGKVAPAQRAVIGPLFYNPYDGVQANSTPRNAAAIDAQIQAFGRAIQTRAQIAAAMEPIRALKKAVGVTIARGNKDRIRQAHHNLIKARIQNAKFQLDTQDREDAEETKDDLEGQLEDEPLLTELGDLESILVTEGVPVIDYVHLMPAGVVDYRGFARHMTSLQNESEGPRKRAYKMAVCAGCWSSGITPDEIRRVREYEGKLKLIDPPFERKGKWTGLTRAMTARSVVDTPRRITAVSQLLHAIKANNYNITTLPAKWQQLKNVGVMARQAADQRPS